MTSQTVHNVLVVAFIFQLPCGERSKLKIENANHSPLDCLEFHFEYVMCAPFTVHHSQGDIATHRFWQIVYSFISHFVFFLLIFYVSIAQKPQQLHIQSECVHVLSAKNDYDSSSNTNKFVKTAKFTDTTNFN